MLKKLSFLVSMPFMAVLLVVLILVLALATFVESAYGVQTSWAVFYGTHWFELLMLLISINIVGVMVKLKFFKRKKIVVLLFHLAFVLILVGAAITRFISYEGSMHIRENTTSNTILSSNAYMDVLLEAGGEVKEYSKGVALTSLTPHSYRMSTSVGGEKVKIKSVEYLSNVVEQFVASPGGIPYIQIMLVTDRQTSIGIPSGTTTVGMGMKMAFNKEDSTAVISFYTEGGEIHMLAQFPVTVMQMGGDTGEEFAPGVAVPIKENTIYSLGEMSLALQGYLPSATKQVVQAPAGQGGSHRAAAKLELTYRGMSSEVIVPGMARLAGQPIRGTMGDLQYTITYGSREIQVPFSLFLKDFEVERYPGSNSPSSFASDVVLLDPEMGIQEERRIFMNNVLKHRGYRFYQSSYDTDE